MFALDFKLTSAQVKVLLYEWHGHRWSDFAPRPARDLFVSKSHEYVRRTLREKGLMEYVGEAREFGEMRLTPQGTALAEHVVLQAQKILALDTSRREFIAAQSDMDAYEERVRAEVMRPVEVQVIRRDLEAPDA